MVQVPPVMLDGAWTNVEERRRSKACGRQVPAGNCEAGPFNDLTQEIRARDILKKAAGRYFVTSFVFVIFAGLFSQVDQNAIMVKVRQPPDGEDRTSRQKLRSAQPTVGVRVQVGERPAL